MPYIQWYLDEVSHILHQLPQDQIIQIVDILKRARLARKHIFLIGNGGSAGTASHFANDLLKSTVAEDKPRIKVIALTDNIPVMLAYANDCGYETIFAEQLDALADSGDVLVAFSGSGRSPNVIRALDLARERGDRGRARGVDAPHLFRHPRRCRVVIHVTTDLQQMPFLLPGTNIEVINRHIEDERGRIRFALLDFDGTISLIRQGWQGVMIPMMVEVLLETPDHESKAELTHIVTDFVTRLTGKQTIYQMIQLAEEVKGRGGTPLDPLEYKREYLRRLWVRIKDRVADLKAGRRSPDDLMVPGARAILKALRARDVACYLASGTDRPYVLDEANALGLPPYFGDHIYGALDDYQSFSKRLVIARILRENHLAGPELVAFGDGFVEIEDTKAAGGIAVGVASNEATRHGIDFWKRQRLIQAGADLIIPDFREHEALIAYLFPP